MAGLISTDALLKRTDWYSPEVRDAVRNALRYVPTCDPVKHGQWTSSQGLAEVGEVQCSNCKTIYYCGDLYLVGETDENGIGQALMPNYCPHCGAKMDEVEE